MRKNRFITISLLSTLAVVVGTLIYVCYRPTTIVAFSWVESAGLTSEVLEIRGAISALVPNMPDVVIHSLPGGLWAFSFALTMGALWNGAPARWSVPFLSLVPLLALGSEIGQGFDVVPGSYDTVDLIFYIVAIAIGFSMTLAPHTLFRKRPL